MRGGQGCQEVAQHSNSVCVCVFDSTGQFLGRPRNPNSTDFKNKSRNPEPFCENSQGKSLCPPLSAAPAAPTTFRIYFYVSGMCVSLVKVQSLSSGPDFPTQL